MGKQPSREERTKLISCVVVFISRISVFCVPVIFTHHCLAELSSASTADEISSFSRPQSKMDFRTRPLNSLRQTRRTYAAEVRVRRTLERQEDSIARES